MISSTNPLNAVWMDKPLSAVKLGAEARIEEAQLELWRRRINLHCHREMLVLARKRYKKHLGKVIIMPDEKVRQTFMSKPPEAGTMFAFTDGTLPTGKFDPDTGEEIRVPNKVLAYCVAVSELPGGGGFATSRGDGMYVVEYIERGKVA